MDLRIEIGTDQVECRQDGTRAFAAPLKEFLAALDERADVLPLPEAIPEGVRFVRRRGNAVVLVIEEKPQQRTVRWLSDESSTPFGKGAIYRTARLAFPFVVAVLAFRGGALTGQQQCFYRVEPLRRLSDPLLLPNLYNVAAAYGQQCWLCLANLRTDLRPLSWNDKVREIRRHLWGAGFNRSSEIHEGMSYWTTMRKVDRRVETIETWEEASREDPFFPLKVAWRPAGRTVGDVINEMIGRVGPPPVVTVAQVAQVLSLLAARAAKLAAPSRSVNDAP
jgi:hypothetical protein